MFEADLSINFIAFMIIRTKLISFSPVDSIFTATGVHSYVVSIFIIRYLLLMEGHNRY